MTTTGTTLIIVVLSMFPDVPIQLSRSRFRTFTFRSDTDRMAGELPRLSNQGQRASPLPPSPDPSTMFVLEPTRFSQFSDKFLDTSSGTPALQLLLRLLKSR